MYSRPNDARHRDMRIPPNYGGNAFNRRETTPPAVSEKMFSDRDEGIKVTSNRRPPSTRPPTYQQPSVKNGYTEEDIAELDNAGDDSTSDDICPVCEWNGDRTEKEERHEQEEKKCAETTKKPISILSPLNNLGTEELLLIALALIVFQGGKDPDLALILLALLFIN